MEAPDLRGFGAFFRGLRLTANLVLSRHPELVWHVYRWSM